MEPRRDDGDDLTVFGDLDVSILDAAMEPRRDDGDDLRPRVRHPSISLPQWSPVVTTGTTARRQGECAHGWPAAMEPRRDDGDDMVLALRPRAEKAAAMEPRRDDGDDEPVGRVAWTMIAEPQWSPVVTTGTTALSHTFWKLRYLAAMEPRRDDGDDAIVRPPSWSRSRVPQWSPVVTTGTTRTVILDRRTVPFAAMEPRRDDGDDQRT